MRGLFFDKDKVEELYPGAFMLRTEKIGSMPKRKHNPPTIESLSESNDYFAQEKKDGFSYTFEKTDKGSYLFGRSTVKSTGLLSEKSDRVPHIVEALDCLPEGTVVVGEIYYPGKTSKDVTSIMNSKVERSHKLQEENGKIHYYVHDIIALRGELLFDKTHLERYIMLENLFDELKLANRYDYLELATIYQDETDFAALFDQLLEDGEEGIVLKRKDFTYSPEKRPIWSTIKLKKSDTADVVCMGFDDATMAYVGKETPRYWIEQVQKDGKWVEVRRYEGLMQGPTEQESRTFGITKPYFMGWKTALKIGAYDSNGELVQIGTVSSGLTDKLRKDMSEHPDEYIGKVVECGIMEKGDQSLRHPIFMRFRDDKDAEECTLKSIF